MKLENLLNAKQIDCYNINKEKEKDNYYRNNDYTEKEKEYTTLLREKLDDYTSVVGGKSINSFLETRFFNDLGFISTIKVSDDVVNVFFCGNTVEEAFLNIILTYEVVKAVEFEYWYRDIYEEEYYKRSGNDNYYNAIIYAELPLQSLKKYYKDNLPEELVSMFENFVNNSTGHTYKFDFDKNHFVRIKTKKQSSSK